MPIYFYCILILISKWQAALCHRSNFDFQIGNKVGVGSECVKNVIIWGNHSATQYPDVNHATVNVGGAVKPVLEALGDDNWVKNEFITVSTITEPPHDKTNKMACAPREDSDQPGHPPSLISISCRMMKAWVFSYPLSASEGSDQTGRMPRLI